MLAAVAVGHVRMGKSGEQELHFVFVIEGMVVVANSLHGSLLRWRRWAEEGGVGEENHEREKSSHGWQ